MPTAYKHLRGQRAVRQWCSEVLARAEFPLASAVVDTSVGQVHLTSAGTGPTRVVLVPGTGFNAAVTLPWLRVLSARWATTVVDLPGQPGLSDARRPRRDGLAWSGRVLDEVLAGLDVEAIVLVGNSLGAAVALAAGSPRIAARALVSAIPPHRDGCLASRRDLSGWLATCGLQPDDQNCDHPRMANELDPPGRRALT